MKNTFNQLLAHQSLSKNEAYQTLLSMGRGELNNAQIAAFLMVFAMRGITVDELEGFRDAMLELCINVSELSDFKPIDVCGTGGDGKDTFNISTLASLVVAGAGQAVAKHGNHGVSSAVGSSTVLEKLGVDFTNNPDKLRRKLETAKICYLHAPLFHPAMKYVAPVRKELGIKTFFNMLGPMTNPAFPKKQLVGVFSLDLARLYAYLYQKTDKKFVILHALDGYDEISLTGDFKIITPHSEQILTPQHLGFETLNAQEITGGATLDDSVQIFLNVLNNQATAAQKNVVLANAGMALHAADAKLPILEAIAKASESLESGRALACFKKLID